jgi:putative peptidoglycan lipid II flippase
MGIHAHFGVSIESDAYYAAFRLPETLGTLLTGGSLAVNAIIPVLLSVQHRRGEQAAWRFTNLLVTTLLVFITPAVLLCMLAAPWFVRYLLAPGFSEAATQLTVVLTRILLTELLLVAGSSVATAVLISRSQFVLPAIAIVLRNVALIVGIGVSMRFPAVGIYGPAVGAVCDSLLQIVVLVPGLLRQGFRPRVVWAPGDPDLREAVRLLIPNGLSGMVNYAGGIVDTAFASLTRVAGDVSALYNAFLLIGLPIRLLGIAIGQAALPRLATQVVAEDWRAMRRTLLRALGVALGLALLAMLALIGGGRFAIWLLFERGAFDAAAGDLTYALLVAYSTALPAAVATEILTRALIALHDTRTPLLTNLGQLAGRLALIPLLLPSVGVLSIPLAFMLTSSVEALVLGGLLRRRLRLHA